MPRLLAAKMLAAVLLMASAGASPRAEERDAASGGSAPAAETIELPAGGLLFVPDDRIAIESQEVVLSRSGVRTTYVLRNATPDPISRVVSWRLPEIDMNVIGESLVVLPRPDPVNFPGATTTVDGAPVPLAFEPRASAFGRDVTDLLAKGGVPLNPLSPGSEDALRRLPPEALADLEERGAVNRDDDRIVPNWLLRTTAFWRQTFAPDATVSIALAYAPVTASDTWRPGSLDALRGPYCIDDALQTAIAGRAAKAGLGLIVHRLTYTLADNSGWWAAIPSFRLAVEKAGLETLIASCWRDLRVAGPTRLETTRRDFRPGEDIQVLFID